ncbi:MAG: bifunctional hydroxymethylpyrimidine kinase/phosphomethylpyrimidine kinase [Erysipelotrichaceae bacterium]|nr:bifunctional hydroxymethylpyrimidine kinase/phosphomethylpyrimidine kinase [Erysipelotrichaceae bacterium]
MKDNGYVVGIGAANIDINGRSFDRVIIHDSNPGRMNMSVGGVSRNILENLSRLGVSCYLLGVVGSDLYGHKILEHSRSAGINMDHVRVVDNHVSSTYMSICDCDGNMALALSDMTIMKEMTVEYLQENDKLISGARAIVTDPSVPPQVMDHLLRTYSHRIPVFLDPVSIGYSKVIKEKTGYFHTIKPNRLEAGLLADIAIETEQDLETACRRLLEKGVQRVIISLGKDGCWYQDQQGNVSRCCLGRVENLKNATGAGDAFMAGIIYGWLNELPITESLEFASAAGIMAIQSQDTVNRELDVEHICRIIKEYKSCQ